MAYSLGNADLDATVAALVADASDNGNQDLIRELVTTVLKLHRDRPDRGDLKLINTALKEMRYSNRVFRPHRDTPKVTVFGSARLGPADPNHALAAAFGAAMVAAGWDVITGAGPGLMEATNQGAGIDHGFGVNIRLPFEDAANPYLDPARIVNFKYFFTRKLGFVKESQGFALLPGGFGTLDETFELFTLIQTGKSDIHPIVLMEAPGTGYWEPLLAFIDHQLANPGLISPDDRSLFRLVDTVEAAVEEITGFYRMYHSQRFVNGRLVLRLNHPLAESAVDEFTGAFPDIIDDRIPGAPFELVDASPAEVADDDHPDLTRLSIAFDRRHFGRLRQLIDRLNELAPASEPGVPGEAFSVDQAERSW